MIASFSTATSRNDTRSGAVSILVAFLTGAGMSIDSGIPDIRRRRARCAYWPTVVVDRMNQDDSVSSEEQEEPVKVCVTEPPDGPARACWRTCGSTGTR